MKNYITPVSSVMSINLNENIAASSSITENKYLWAGEGDEGILINIQGCTKGEFGGKDNLAKLWAWLRDMGQDPIGNGCI